MNKSHELFQELSRKMVFERNQGLDFEARRVVPSGWTLECHEDGYTFIGSWSDEWEITVWRLVQFLSYKATLALRCSGVGDNMEYELVTCMEEGTGFRAVFRSRPTR